MDGSEPITYRRTSGNWPAGTATKAAELDALGLPAEASNREARAALKGAGTTVGSSAVLAAAIRYRRSGTPSGTPLDDVAWNGLRNTAATLPSTRVENTRWNALEHPPRA